jgi:hypothetical protein
MSLAQSAALQSCPSRPASASGPRVAWRAACAGRGPLEAASQLPGEGLNEDLYLSIKYGNSIPRLPSSQLRDPIRQL